MRIIEVVEARRWRNVETGVTASIYGACPWWSAAKRQQWIMETIGWTWRLDNGTVGRGRPPVATRQEAIAIMKQLNAAADERRVALAAAIA